MLKVNLRGEKADESNSNIVPNLLPVLDVRPEMLDEVALDATMSWF